MKKIILLLITVSFFNCSISSDEECFNYYINLSSSCDCLTPGTCSQEFTITKEEFNRLEELQANSANDCIFVETINTIKNSSSEGYLIELITRQCTYGFA